MCLGDTPQGPVRGVDDVLDEKGRFIVPDKDVADFIHFVFGIAGD
jgi:hypothetical protein